MGISQTNKTKSGEPKDLEQSLTVDIAQAPMKENVLLVSGLALIVVAASMVLTTVLTG